MVSYSLKTDLLKSFVPQIGKAWYMADTVIMVVKIILFIIVLILSIISLAGASKSKSTGKGKGVLALSVFIFLMTLGLLVIGRIGGTNTTVILYLIVYFILALLSTIFQYQNIDVLEDDEEKKQAKNSARSTTGIVVLIGIFMIGGFWVFKMSDAGAKMWGQENYFLH